MEHSIHIENLIKDAAQKSKKIIERPVAKRPLSALPAVAAVLLAGGGPGVNKSSYWDYS